MFVRRRSVLAALTALCALPARAASSTREQCETLKRAALQTAQQFLRTHGEFPPYGLGLAARDEVVQLNEDDAPPSVRQPDHGDALRARLAEALKSHAVDATALVYEATLSSPPAEARGDAIAIQLAHRDGYRAVIVTPYRFRGSDVVLGPSQLIEQKGAVPRPKRRK